MRKRERFSARGVYLGENLSERPGTYWREEGCQTRELIGEREGGVCWRGVAFLEREREEIVGEGTLLLKNIIKGGIVRERGLFENLLYSQLQIEIYLFMIRNRSIKRIFTFLILFFSE